MLVVDLATQPSSLQEQAATILHASFNHPLGWPTMESAREELATILMPTARDDLTYICQSP